MISSALTKKSVRFTYGWQSVKRVKGFFIVENGRQIVITGVKGAGRRFFASLYFPKSELEETKIRLSAKPKEVLVVVILDCSHLQNQEEADMLEDVASAINRCKSRSVRLLIVFGRIDLVCTHHQNRKWLECVIQEYKPYLKKIKAKKRTVIAHSNLAVLRFRQICNGGIDADDVDDINYLLAKAGRRLPAGITMDNVQEYLGTHKGVLQRLTGEYFVNRFFNSIKSRDISL